MDLGKKLKAERIKRNWTQEYVASQLNVARSTISSWEIQRTYPDLETLVALSDLYEVSLDILLREDQHMTHRLNKEIKKGRALKWILLAGILVILSLLFFTDQQLKKQTLLPINVDNVVSATVDLQGKALNEKSVIQLNLRQQNYRSFSVTKKMTSHIFPFGAMKRKNRSRLHKRAFLYPHSHQKN